MTESSGESLLVRLARELGWRAYAIPVLVVITVWVLIDVFTATADGGDSPEASSADESTEPTTEIAVDSGPNPGDSPALDLGIKDLPPGGPFTDQGEGTYFTVGATGASAGVGEELVMRYIVEVEDGVDTAGFGGGDAFAAMVDATLANPKGWTDDPRYRFEHVADDEEPDMRIQLTSVGTTHAICGAELDMETSCHIKINGTSHVVINQARWIRGATPFNGDLGSYRQYLINHEVGHGLGYAAHEPCLSDGELAPVMMQQTLSLNNSELHSFNPNEIYPDDNKTCVYNPWPFPRTATS
ncbi:DUF3152 domain-containing protein [Corynebacterium alimapuense]|uniref:DUF3152 domain-containing protein n=1 Tax=Corynebacterium alimapuense TaxID=1576874 RepID=A0A3M8K686_9CORY|nr:DUF3152 domain-containing protein [Corynebacterium alimapuense]RNE48733.1 hypothetical protein C5L39_05320 [Corynebacterium alimapuense]